MKLQEKISEFIRESEDMDDDLCKNARENGMVITIDSDYESGFVAGQFWALECVLNLLMHFKVNPELDGRGG